MVQMRMERMLTLISMILAILAVTAEGTAQPEPDGAQGAASRETCVVRFVELDALAQLIAEMGEVPAGADLLLWSAASGWPAQTSAILLLPPGEDIVASVGCLDTGGDTIAVGLYPGRPDESNIVVCARFPRVIPLIEDCFPAADTALRLAFTGLSPETSYRLLVSTPDLDVYELRPDSGGAYDMQVGSKGLYWVELLSMEHTGPSVELLFPLAAGHEPGDVAAGDIPVFSSSACSLDDVLTEINGLRSSLGLAP
ncbi:hypothetical protein JW921_03110, partial [Candidatus Fermentibacterales bacterium]|nr:hypothetical protein [Candidatus Fermentibacterales bacterium]